MEKCSYIIPKTKLQCKRNKSVGCDFCYQHFPKNKKEEVDEGSIENCTVCFDPKKYPLIILQCTHTFHQKCLLDWTKKNINCPLCRQNIVTYTIQKTEKSKPIQKDFKKELYDKYLPHLLSLTSIFNVFNDLFNSTEAFQKREKIHILFGCAKSINEFMLADGKYIIIYDPSFKKQCIDNLTNFMNYCSEECPEYVAELMEFNKKFLDINL